LTYQFSAFSTEMRKYKAYSYTILENKLIGLFYWIETKSSLSAKSGIACFKNVWLLSVSWDEPR